MDASPAVSPLRQLVTKLRPDLLDNPTVAEVLAAFEGQLSEAEVAQLSRMVAPLSEAWEKDDYPEFKRVAESFGYGMYAPFMYSMLQENRPNE